MVVNIPGMQGRKQPLLNDENTNAGEAL